MRPVEDVISELTSAVHEDRSPELPPGRIRSDDQIRFDRLIGDVQEMKITLDMLVERITPLIEYAERLTNGGPTERLKAVFKK